MIRKYCQFKEIFYKKLKIVWFSKLMKIKFHLKKIKLTIANLKVLVQFQPQIVMLLAKI